MKFTFVVYEKGPCFLKLETKENKKKTVEKIYKGFLN